MDSSDARTLTPTRTVRVYADRSELLYLRGDKRYVWMRPRPDGPGYDETPVPAGNDMEAITETGMIAYVERMQQSKGGEADMDERIPDHVIIVKCAPQTQKNSRIVHLFRAAQWKSTWRPGTRTMAPVPPIRDRQWWHDHYRLRIDGRWHGEATAKYRFYTKDEVMAIITDLIGFKVEL